MITYVIFVLMVYSASAKSFNSLGSIPPYVQSHDAFTRSRLYLEKNLPQEIKNITNAKIRVHYGFATVVKVTSELAFAVRPTSPPQRYNPIKILDACIPAVSNEYNIIANATKDYVSKSINKIEPISKMIKKKCHSTTNIDACNEKVAITIKSSGNDIKMRGKFLLQLGKASEHVNSYTNLLNIVIAENKEIPYLKHHVQDPCVTRMMKDFAATHSLLNSIDYS